MKISHLGGSDSQMNIYSSIVLQNEPGLPLSINLIANVELPNSTLVSTLV